MFIRNQAKTYKVCAYILIDRKVSQRARGRICLMSLCVKLSGLSLCVWVWVGHILPSLLGRGMHQHIPILMIIFMLRLIVAIYIFFTIYNILSKWAYKQSKNKITHFKAIQFRQKLFFFFFGHCWDLDCFTSRLFEWKHIKYTFNWLFYYTLSIESVDFNYNCFLKICFFLMDWGKTLHFISTFIQNIPFSLHKYNK